VVQFSRKRLKSLVETIGPLDGNRKAPDGIHSATISLLPKPGEARYVIANKGNFFQAALHQRLAGNLQ
jgi:hypothetical protein